ncbi:MAG: serine/threonine-protein kinase [Polyangiaceae bacterium]
MRSDEIHPGDLIAGKYRVRTILGRKHGLLVDAFHTEFDQRVVIKVLLAGYGEDKEIERFRREARTLSKLESEHAARIIDVGTEQDGSFYLVRQFLEGVDLETHVRQGGPLPLHEAALYILQAAEAVAETHSHGIIVRELEPRTLFLTQRAGGACVKMIDFGTAKLMRDAAAPTAGGDLTATAMFGLSPYSSPELVRKAKNVDARTDVWSLGACLYHLLAARPPVGGDTGTLMLAITREEPAPITHLRPDLPAELDDILGWALAKDVDARFRNVHALAHALAAYTGPEGQVLAERIGRMTEAARSRRSGAPPAPPSYAPPSQPGPPSQAPHSHRQGSGGDLDFDESVTVLNRQYTASPSFPGIPAPPSSRPGSVPPPPSSVPPPPPSLDPYAVAAPPVSMPGAAQTHAVPSVVPATWGGPWPASGPSTGAWRSVRSPRPRCCCRWSSPSSSCARRPSPPSRAGWTRRNRVRPEQPSTPPGARLQRSRPPPRPRPRPRSR